jgi:hypothetical protein
MSALSPSTGFLAALRGEYATLSATSARTRSGRYRQKLQAVSAPQSCAATNTCLSPSESRSATRSPTTCSAVYCSAPPSGTSEPPYPRMSGATARYPAAASAGIWWRQVYHVSGKPWSSSTVGAPAGPASATCMRTPVLSSTVRCVMSMSSCCCFGGLETGDDGARRQQQRSRKQSATIDGDGVRRDEQRARPFIGDALCETELAAVEPAHQRVRLATRVVSATAGLSVCMWMQLACRGSVLHMCCTQWRR